MRTIKTPRIAAALALQGELKMKRWEFDGGGLIIALGIAGWIMVGIFIFRWLNN